jgi:transcriptional regulator with XRE-family HTH domain
MSSLCRVKKRSPRKYYVDEELLKKVGTKIREIRTIKNISQETFANECGTVYSQVNRIELGKLNFSISYLYRIARALEVDGKDLLP